MAVKSCMECLFILSNNVSLKQLNDDLERLEKEAANNALKYLDKNKVDL